MYRLLYFIYDILSIIFLFFIYYFYLPEFTYSSNIFVIKPKIRDTSLKKI